MLAMLRPRILCIMFVLSCVCFLFFTGENISAIMIDQGSFSVMSLNVRGLRNQVKRRSIFRFLKDENYLFYFLQETYSKPGDEIILEK